MPVIHLGHKFELNSVVFKIVESNSVLVGLGVTSELSRYTQLAQSMLLNNSTRIKLNYTIASSIKFLYHYDPSSLKWFKITNFKQSNDTIILDKLYNGILLAFPFDVFRESLYTNGEYIYELYLNRNDSRVYKDIEISTSTYKQQEFIDIEFSLSNTGPWYKNIKLYSIVDTIYLKVTVSNISVVNVEELIPSEIINISCLVCE
jgi:hypothetical protein